MQDGMKICIICSAGGHLREAMQLESVFDKREHFFVTFNRRDAIDALKGKKTYFINDPKRNPLKAAVNFFKALSIYLKERPRVIISTGAGMAIPFCYIGKALGSKIVYIESMAAVVRPSLTGKTIYPIADMFIVQWAALKRFYPKAAYGGTII